MKITKSWLHMSHPAVRCMRGSHGYPKRVVGCFVLAALSF
ncbi:hypothetical protein TPCCA_0936a [Treponema paraluiscuniculi Cuniculi A]|uniref:Uncharacterized protein n=2 Tax=Treponema paraluiscuniculi TaxID=53435 RepID=F7XR18_TREPU|nr:hypothetical protein TPCCA_0936a [Treponema paraluiscuniculi Cuniculi A]WKC72789.1 hypothetical protein TPLL2_0936a [Treponema paraluiscuniculi]